MTVPLVSFTADFAVPLSIPGSGAKETESINEEAVGIIVSMGFSQPQAIKALKATVSVLRHCRVSWSYKLKGLGHAILGNFNTDQVVIEFTKISK